MKTYTVREAAELLGTSKSTIHRLLRTELDLFSEVGHTTYRGHQAFVVSEQGLEHLRKILSESQARHESNQETSQNDSSASRNESGHFSESHSESDLVAVLRAELEAKNRQIEALTSALERAQEATAAAQALHAATVRLIGPSTAQAAQQPEEGTDTTTEPEDAQEAPREATMPENGVEEITVPSDQTATRASLRDRLRILFTGR